jgi:hypothetical protein
MSGELKPDLYSFDQAKLGSLGRLTSDSKSSSVLLIRALQLDDFTQAMTQVRRRRKIIRMILHQIRLHLFKIFKLQWLKNSSKLAREILAENLLGVSSDDFEVCDTCRWVLQLHLMHPA